jgi:Trypsin
MMGRIRVALLACLALALLAVVPAAHAQSAEPRVVGGNPATIEQYPWQAAVAVTEDDFPGFDAFDRQFCGGTLITRSIVLTAAHCVYDTDPDCGPAGPVGVCLQGGLPSDDPGDDGTKKMDPGDLSVVLGVTTLSTAGPADEHAIDASPADGVSYDLSFDPDPVPQFDVGYLVLETPATLGAKIAPIDIAGNDEEALWDPGVLEDVSGWGSTSEGGNGVDTLRAASVPIVSDSTCGSPGINGTDFDPATMVCAGFLSGGVDTCAGDSGGPLQAPLEGGGYRMVGITSWGVGCARPNKPGVYTRIAEAGPGGLRDEVVTEVDELEVAFGLPDEEIVGNGGSPKGAAPPASAPTGAGPATAATVSPSPRANDPYLKCHKIKHKGKRRICFRKVRASLGR